MKRLTGIRDWRLIHGAAVLLVLGLMLVELRGVLSPLVLFAALVVLMIPYSGSQFHRLLILTGAVLVSLWMLSAMGTLLAPFVLAFVLGYILDPLVDRLEAWRIPRGLGVAILALPVAGAITALILFAIPALAAELESLIRRVPEALETVARWVEGWEAGLLGIDLPLVDERVLADRIRGVSPGSAAEFLEGQRSAIAERAWDAVLGLGRGLGTVFTILGYIVLTPVLTFYLLRDWDSIVARVTTLIPRPRVAAFTAFGREYDRLLSRYLRGQLLAAGIVGVLTWLGLWIAGFPNPGLVGAVAGVFNVVPYLGLPVSLIPAMIIALISGSFLSNIVKVAIVFGIVQGLDGNVIGPRITGETTGLHPVLVILALAVAGFLFGFVGFLLAIPAAILVKLLVEAALGRYRRAAVYLGAERGQAVE
ncbi:MAG TPA: AI-2E family transporter [Longimicrobiales bacterium]|nr:AI-2E family transporter [Longimicrobiales bacterium]